MEKVAVIGAGSASFGLSTLAAIMRHPGLRGVTLALVDTDAAALADAEALARRLSAAWGAGIAVEASPDRARVLEGADAVVVSLAVDREATWARDRALAQRFGLEHYAENGGPAGLLHAARSVRAVLPVARDVERLAPDALVLVYTNPLPRVCRALTRATSLRVVGLCHQIRFGYAVAAVALAEELGAPVPPGWTFRWTDEDVATEHALADHAMARLEIRAAGLNHFTWMLGVRDRATGEDVLPRLRDHLVRRVHADFEPLTRRLAGLTGLVPVSGDTHLSEYLPFTAREGWARYAIQAYDHAWSERRRRAARAQVARLARGEGDLEALRGAHGEGAEDILAAVREGAGAPLPAVNVPNRGAIAGLPDDAVVEVPGRADAAGVHGQPVGALPGPVGEWCRREAAVVERVVGAVLEGRRDLALEAFLLDPMIGDLDVAEALLDAYLAADPEALAGVG